MAPAVVELGTTAPVTGRLTLRLGSSVDITTNAISVGDAQLELDGAPSGLSGTTSGDRITFTFSPTAAAYTVGDEVTAQITSSGGSTDSIIFVIEPFIPLISNGSVIVLGPSTSATVEYRILTTSTVTLSTTIIGYDTDANLYLDGALEYPHPFTMNGVTVSTTLSSSQFGYAAGSTVSAYLQDVFTGAETATIIFHVVSASIGSAVHGIFPRRVPRRRRSR